MLYIFAGQGEFLFQYLGIGNRPASLMVTSCNMMHATSPEMSFGQIESADAKPLSSPIAKQSHNKHD